MPSFQFPFAVARSPSKLNPIGLSPQPRPDRPTGWTSLNCNSGAIPRKPRRMSEDTAQRIRIWRFRNAPANFRSLFPHGHDADWIVHAAESELRIIEPSLLGWRRIYPVEVLNLEDGSSVFWGAPRAAVASIAGLGSPALGTGPDGAERRASLRIRIECPLHYEILSEPRRAGEGHTIDISSSGIRFAAHSPLPMDARVNVQVKWPIALEAGLNVELHAVGKVVRTVAREAAIQVEDTKFLTPL